MFGYQQNQYVIFPNTSNPAANDSVKDVLDIQHFGNRIFVLVDHRFSNTADIGSVIHVFGTDGSYLRSSGVLSALRPASVRNFSPMECGVPPVGGTSCMTMLDRIDRDAIRVTGEIVFIPNGMLAEATLPDPAFAPGNPPRGSTFIGRYCTREDRLHGVPAVRVVGVSRWQGPDAMQVIRQNDDGVDRERLALHSSRERRA